MAMSYEMAEVMGKVLVEELGSGAAKVLVLKMILKVYGSHPSTSVKQSLARLHAVVAQEDFEAKIFGKPRRRARRSR